MLKQRVITAFVLFGVLLAAVMMPSVWPLLALIAAMSAITMWEWLRLTCSPAWRVLIIPIVVTSTALLLFIAYELLAPSASSVGFLLIGLIHDQAVPLVCFLWVVGATIAVINGHVATQKHCLPLSLFAILACLVLWYSLAVLYLAFDALFLLSLMALIWSADSAAYFTGRKFGKHKLAPKISPGKTIEGALGGIAGALVCMVLSSFWQGSFAHYMVHIWGAGVMVVATILLTALSIVGDLFESMLKRRVNVKDSSQLLPGHGGMFDRLDSLLPVAPVALLIMRAL